MNGSLVGRGERCYRITIKYDYPDGINPDSNGAFINSQDSPYQDSEVNDKNLSQADIRKMNRLNLS